MPTYEYRCDACEARFERFQKMTDDPVAVCPECGEEEVQRLISRGGGVVFKGSGFYATDYRDPPKQASREGEDGSGGGDGASGDGGSGGDGEGSGSTAKETSGEGSGGADD